MKGERKERSGEKMCRSGEIIEREKDGVEAREGEEEKRESISDKGVRVWSVDRGVSMQARLGSVFSDDQESTIIEFVRAHPEL